MKYHLFTPRYDDETKLIVAVSNSNRCKVVYNDTDRVGISNIKPNTYIHRSQYRHFCNGDWYTHKVLTEGEYLLELI